MLQHFFSFNSKLIYVNIMEMLEIKKNFKIWNINYSQIRNFGIGHCSTSVTVYNIWQEFTLSEDCYYKKDVPYIAIKQIWFPIWFWFYSLKRPIQLINDSHKGQLLYSCFVFLKINYINNFLNISKCSFVFMYIVFAKRL